MKERDAKLDYAKAVAAVLVVLSHITVYDYPYKVNEVLDSLYPLFHNSTFYFISGYLFQFSVNKYSLKSILVRKFMDTIVLAILWSSVFVVFIFFIDGNKEDFFSLVWEAGNYMWFFAVLFFGYCAIIVTRWIRINKWVATIIWFSAFLFTITFSSVIGKVFVFSYMMWIGYNTKEINSRLLWADMMVFIVAFIGVIRIRPFLENNGTWYSSLYSIATLSLSAFCCRIIPKISYTRIHGWIVEKTGKKRWEFLGQSSIYLYILQVVPLMIYRRIGLFRLWLAAVFFVICIFISFGFRWISNKKDFFYIRLLFKPSLLLETEN